MNGTPAASFRRRWMPRLVGFSFVIPLFLDVGPTGISLGSGIFESPAHPMTQTVPFALVVAITVCLIGGLKALLRGRVNVRGPRGIWIVMGVYLSWLTLVLVVSPDTDLVSVMFLAQAAIPFLGYIVGLYLVNGEQSALRFAQGIMAGLAATIWFHLTGFVYEVGIGGALGTRMLTTAWGLNIYQAYNYYPVVLAMALVFVTTTYVGSKGLKFRLWLHGFLLVIPAIFLILLLGVRGAIGVGLAGAIAVAALSSMERRQRALSFVMVGVILIVMVGAGVVYWRAHPELQVGFATLERIQYMLAAEEAGAATGLRANILADTWRLLGRDWQLLVIGTGLTPPVDVFGEAMYSWTSAHNYYVDLLVWTGVPGLVAMVVLLWLVVCHLFKRLRSSDNMSRAAVIGSLGVVLAVCLVSNNLRVPLRQPYSGILFWALVGAVIDTQASDEWNRDLRSVKASSEAEAVGGG